MDVGRQEVYAAVDAEFDDAASFVIPEHTLGEFILMLNESAVQARRKWSEGGEGPDGFPESLHEVRKIAALAVRCMVQHGTPKRLQTGLMAAPEAAAAQGSGSDW
jgi:hypothetical protein